MSRNITARTVWAYILKHIKPFPVSIIALFVVAFISGADLSLRSYVLKVILNRLVQCPQTEVFSYLALPVMLYLGRYLLWTFSHRIFDYFVEITMIPQMRENIAHDALGMLLDKSHTYYQNNFSGSLNSKIFDLLSCVPDVIQCCVYQLALQVFALVVTIVTLWYVNILFALAMMFFTLVFVIFAFFFSQRLSRLSARWAESGAIIAGRVVDILSNILSVRLFTSKNSEQRGLDHAFKDSVEAERNLQWSYCFLWLFYGCSFFLLQVFNFYFLLKGRQAEWITVGDFALVLVLNTAVADTLWKVAQEFTKFSKYYGRIAQALTMILERSVLEDKQDAQELVVSAGQITFSGVKFHYPGAEPLFQNKSVTIEAGQKVGLVGYSGGGKSTFVNLILRLYDVEEGNICIDGQDIRAVTQDSLRFNIAMIPQDPSLFHRTLMENIRYGRNGATDEDVSAAAKKAYADEFICRLARGYDSWVGERGVKLSGGQRQRIAIARAILKNAPILILDEATSQLDSVTERYVQEGLWELMQNKTTIVVAHRLSTLLKMDRILVFDQGQIVEDGSHADLLNKNGFYAALWNAQVGGFLPDKKDNEGIV